MPIARKAKLSGSKNPKCRMEEIKVRLSDTNPMIVYWCTFKLYATVSTLIQVSIIWKYIALNQKKICLDINSPVLKYLNLKTRIKRGLQNYQMLFGELRNVFWTNWSFIWLVLTSNNQQVNSTTKIEHIY